MPSLITSPEKQTLYVEEMAIYLWDEFGVLPSPSSVKRALASAGWTRKKAQQKAREQNPELRDFYQHKLSEFRSYHLVFVDESGCDKRVGYRRSGRTLPDTTGIHTGRHLIIPHIYRVNGC
ncbi:hypothetical protein MAP00_009263 [Monascus purpureus]|nr:hypothetical protein MAP00_009263 [Monascus purpureus]